MVEEKRKKKSAVLEATLAQLKLSWVEIGLMLRLTNYQFSSLRPAKKLLEYKALKNVNQFVPPPFSWNSQLQLFLARGLPNRRNHCAPTHLLPNCVENGLVPQSVFEHWFTLFSCILSCLCRKFFNHRHENCALVFRKHNLKPLMVPQNA